jgi:hypothetical protein
MLPCVNVEYHMGFDLYLLFFFKMYSSALNGLALH